MYTNLLEKIAQALDKHKISYMVVGGQAVLLYGEPRLTRDIDITLGLGPEALPSLLRFVQDAGLLAPVTASLCGRNATGRKHGLNRREPCQRRRSATPARRRRGL